MNSSDDGQYSSACGLRFSDPCRGYRNTLPPEHGRALGAAGDAGLRLKPTFETRYKTDAMKPNVSAQLRFVTLLLLIALQLVTSLPAVRADTPFEMGNNIHIESAIATPAQPGDASRVSFRIINDSTADFHLIGISTPVACEAKLLARIGPTATTVLDSIGIPEGEALDLTTSHLWYEIRPVLRDLHVGATFEMTLNFAGGQLTVPVHVHENPSEQ